MRAPEQSHGRSRHHGVGRRPRAFHRLAKIETAIFRHKTITFDYYTIERDKQGIATVDPYQLLFQGGQFYLIGHAHERDAIRVFSLSRMSGKVAYATKAEHDFQRPSDFDPRATPSAAIWQFGDIEGVSEDRVDRAGSPGRSSATSADTGTIEPGKGGKTIFSSEYSQSRALVSWMLGLGANAGMLGPKELVKRVRAEAEERLGTVARPRRSQAWRPQTRRRGTASKATPDPSSARRTTRPRAGSDPTGAIRPSGHPCLDPDQGRAGG